MTKSNSFGINWKLWENLASHNSAFEWSSAALIWCDTVIGATQRVCETSSLMIDNVFFDYMRVVPIFSKCKVENLLSGKQVLTELMSTNPYEFQFDKLRD